MTDKPYVSLHNHTVFSIMHALTKPVELFKRAKELGQPAIAVCDSNTLGAAWDCLKYSKEVGIKLIMGCEFDFVDEFKSENTRSRHVVLHAKNHKGYQNLLKLLKEANENGVLFQKKNSPRIDWKLLEKYSEDLICLTACAGGILGQSITAKKLDKAKQDAVKLKEIFGENLGFEIQPNNVIRSVSAYNDYADQRQVNHQLIKLGKELDVRVVATTNSHYLKQEHHKAHDLMLAIGAGQPVRSNNRLRYDDNFYMKTREEVRTFFSRLYKEQAEVFCDNSLYFAGLCEDPEWISPKFGDPSRKELPTFPVKDQSDYGNYQAWLKTQNETIQKMEEDKSYLRYSCAKQFKKKVPAGKEEEYKARLEEEFDVLEYHGFSSYMLIVADYLNFCVKNGKLIGPGRGSVGGSLVAYLTGIHQADPIKYDLIFARFHNKDKKSYPDVDSDFSPSFREEVQKYIEDKYGADKVAHVSNYSTVTPKVYARDLARAFEFGGDRKAAVAIGNAIADAIPDEIGSQKIDSVKQALEKAPLFAEYANKYKELREYAEILDGKVRNFSTHAAGIVIGSRPLFNVVPTRIDTNNQIALEYEKERAEANGLVKMDLLGLETLDVITNTYNIINKIGKSIDHTAVTFDYEKFDQETYDLISRGDTLGIFQLGGSGGTTEICKQIQPKSIDDISMINSLARPSAAEFRTAVADAKHGKREIKLLHPSLERALGRTYNVGLYEECLFYAAQDVAGWDLNEADRLRKMTKNKGKDQELVSKLKKEFVEGALVKHKDMSKDLAIKIFEEVCEGFQGYGFNRSHSILYSFISYHTAYLKAHYKLPFLCATLISESNSNAKKAAGEILKLKEEIRKSDVEIVPPSINRSLTTYTVLDDRTLLSGISAVKFTGKDCGPEILKKRPFSSLEDLLTKVDTRKVRSNAIQALAAAGALDEFGKSRKQIFLYASDFKKKFSLWSKRNTDKDAVFNYPWPDVGEWTPAEKAAMEIHYLGESLNRNTREIYPSFFPNNAADFKKILLKYKDEEEKRIEHNSVRDGEICGVIRDYHEWRVKKETSKVFGQTMARITLEDVYGNSASVVLFPEQLKQFHSRIRQLGGKNLVISNGCALVISGTLEINEGNLGIIFSDLKKINPPPPKPKDKELEPRSVKMKISTPKKRIKTIESLDLFMNDVEDELTENGEGELELKMIEEAQLEQEFEPKSNLMFIDEDDYKDPFS